MRGFTFALCFVLLAIALGGCSDDDDAPTPDDGAGTTTPIGSATSGPGRPGSNVTPPPGTTATNTPVPPPGCPIEPDACARATQLETALGDGNRGQIVVALLPTTIDCSDVPDEPQGPDPRVAFCAGLPEGTSERSGYLVGPANSDALTYVEGPGFADFLLRAVGAPVRGKHDDFGPGAVRLYTVAEAPDCDGCYVFVYSVVRIAGIDPVALERVVITIRARQEGDDWFQDLAAAGRLIGDPEQLTGGTVGPTVYEPWNADGGEGAPPGAQIAYAGLVEVIESDDECLNLREEPSTEAEVLDCQFSGTLLTVLDGPEEGDAFTWWRVRGAGGDDIPAGWVAGEFIAPAQ